MENFGIEPIKRSNRSNYKRFRLLTPRETQILVLICDGMSNEEIGKELDIQTETVKYHLKKVYEVFNTTRRHTLIIEAIKTGTVRPAWITEIRATI